MIRPSLSFTKENVMQKFGRPPFVTKKKVRVRLKRSHMRDQAHNFPLLSLVILTLADSQSLPRSSKEMYTYSILHLQEPFHPLTIVIIPYLTLESSSIYIHPILT